MSSNSERPPEPGVGTREVPSLKDKEDGSPETASAPLAIPLEPGGPDTNASQELQAGFHRAIVAAAISACLAAPLVLALGLPSTVRFPVVLALFSLAPGTALVTILGGRTEVGLVLGASLGLSTVIAQSMLWLHAWQPELFAYSLAIACLPPLVVRLASSGRSGAGGRALAAARPRAHRPTGVEAMRLAWAHTRLRLNTLQGAVRGIPPSVAGHVLLLTVAVVAWAASLSEADLGRISGIGLVGALPPSYFVALGLLLAGFALAVTRLELAPKLLGLYVVFLILVLHGTTPLLYDEPRYPWVFKHIGVIDSIVNGGAADREIDIYHNWPGFFALNAWLTSVSGLAQASYAPWAQVFFNLLNVVALRFALRGVTGNKQLLWIATWFFLLGNWVGQDYLAPQALAFVLSLVVIGLCLRCGRQRPPGQLRDGRRLMSRLDRLRKGLLPHWPGNDPTPVGPFSGRGAVVVGGFCYLAVVLSHQLTPVMLLAGVTGLALLLGRVPLWVPAAMAVVEAWWLALAWPYLSEHYSIFDPDPGASGVPEGYEPGRGLPGVELVVYAPRLLFGILAILAIFGIARRLRDGRWDPPAAILILGPLLVFMVQSYGGEGRYRFYLLALPWLCFLAAAACAPTISSRLPNLLRSWRLALASGATGGCLLFAYFGLELIYRVTPEEVTAGVWFEQHAPRDSIIVDAAANQPPSRLTARYPNVYDPAYTGSPALTRRPEFRHRKLGPRDLPRVESMLRDYGARHTFLRVAKSHEDFTRLYGILPEGWRQSFVQALSSSPSFRLVYGRGSYSIFQYRPRSKGDSLHPGAPRRRRRQLPRGKELRNARLRTSSLASGAGPARRGLYPPHRG